MNEVVVLVPVLNRPRNVAPLVESFAKSETPGRLLFIANESDADERDAIEAAKGHPAAVSMLLVPDRVLTWPQKINAAYRCDGGLDYPPPWMLCAADDVHFHPGWWQATQALRDAGFGVIGTADLGNSRVMQGLHTCHPLVRREYADKQGTLDGPGAVVHEGYRHWCVDDELVATAKARGAWAFCREAVVEHLHPYWRKAEWDATYALGEANAKSDMELWKKRRELLA